MAAQASSSTASGSNSTFDSTEAISDMQLDESNPTTLKPPYRVIPDQDKPKTNVTKKCKQVNEFQERVLHLVESQNEPVEDADYVDLSLQAVGKHMKKHLMKVTGRI